MNTPFLLWLQQAFSENLGLKGMALLFSLGFFGYLHGREDIQQRTIPVSIISLPPEGGAKELMTLIPAGLHLTVRGPGRAMTALIQNGVTPLELDLRQGYPARIHFTDEMFSLPREIELVLVDPPSLDLGWDDIVTRQVPLHASVTGQPADGRAVHGEPRVDPEQVTVRGPRTLVETMQFARLEPYVVNGLTEGTWARRIAIEAPAQRVRVLGSPAATVAVEIVRRLSSRTFLGVEVQLIGPTRATALPSHVDITVTGPPEAVAALRADQVVPRADLSLSTTWDKDATHGTATVPVTVPLNAIESEVQPPSVTAKW
jgi:hypothetical protein